MDIVSRIKTFLEVNGISISQFADTCRIPRPTMSQLLKGRNKKVSDELIAKIHTGYPPLSISWLLFGEGEMLSSTVNSENGQDRENVIFSGNSPSLFDDEILDGSTSTENQHKYPDNRQVNIDGPTDSRMAELASIITNGGLNLSRGEAPDRKVVQIIVFYSDNSFEHFRPVSD